MEEFFDWYEKEKFCHTPLLNFVDKDVQAFNRIMKAFELPKTILNIHQFPLLLKLYSIQLDIPKK